MTTRAHAPPQAQNCTPYKECTWYDECKCRKILVPIQTKDSITYNDIDINDLRWKIVSNLTEQMLLHRYIRAQPHTNTPTPFSTHPIRLIYLQHHTHDGYLSCIPLNSLLNATDPSESHTKCKQIQIHTPGKCVSLGAPSFSASY